MGRNHRANAVRVRLTKAVLAEHTHPPAFWPARTLNGSARDRHEAENLLDVRFHPVRPQVPPSHACGRSHPRGVLHKEPHNGVRLDCRVGLRYGFTLAQPAQPRKSAHAGQVARKDRGSRSSSCQQPKRFPSARKHFPLGPKRHPSAPKRFPSRGQTRRKQRPTFLHASH